MYFNVINGKIVDEALKASFDIAWEAIKEAYILHDMGKSVNPNSHFLRFPDRPSSRIIALPAFLGGEFQVSGLKWIASYPENIVKGIPRASAVLILNDTQTGYPYACIESSIISAMRTAISAVIAAEYLTEKSVAKVGFIGNGLIASYIANVFKQRDWSFKEIFLYDACLDRSKKFGLSIRNNQMAPETICSSVDELVSKSDLVIFATTAQTPYFNNLSVLTHNPCLLNISLRDISSQVLLASNNIVDDVEHVLNANTSPHLAFQQSKDKGFINGNLADVLNNRFSYDKTKPTVFSPMGMGILDLALGKIVYDYASKKRLGVSLDDFFEY